jgi:hypothetical protein
MVSCEELFPQDVSDLLGDVYLLFLFHPTDNWGICAPDVEGIAAVLKRHPFMIRDLQFTADVFGTCHAIANLPEDGCHQAVINMFYLVVTSPYASLTPEIAVAIGQTIRDSLLPKRVARSTLFTRVPALKLLAVAITNPDFAAAHVTDDGGRLQCHLFERAFLRQYESFRFKEKKEVTPVIGNVLYHLDINLINDYFLAQNALPVARLFMSALRDALDLEDADCLLPIVNGLFRAFTMPEFTVFENVDAVGHIYDAFVRMLEISPSFRPGEAAGLRRPHTDRGSAVARDPSVAGGGASVMSGRCKCALSSCFAQWRSCHSLASPRNDSIQHGL